MASRLKLTRWARLCQGRLPCMCETMLRPAALCLVALAVQAGAKEDEKKTDGPVISIDLGTMHSCAGIYKKGRVETIPNDQATTNPSQTPLDAKRLIGRRFKDSTVQKSNNLLPFKIVDKNSEPMISVKVKGEDKVMAPEDVSSTVFTKMKETAEN